MKSVSTEEQMNDLSDNIQPPPSKKTSIQYGNLKMISRGRVHISIGPDYPFTMIAFVFLSIVSYALYKFGQFVYYGPFGEVLNVIIVVIPLLSFAFTALSNPGIYNSDENDEPKTKYCEDCKVFKPKNVFHCRVCNICIEGYDHHCPWLSKCVGRKNIVSFYVFIISAQVLFFYFGYLIYRAVATSPKP